VVARSRRRRPVLLAAGRQLAGAIYESIGVYLGYAVAQYADFYELRHVLVLGRVMSGEGGDVILSTARQVLKEEFPELEESVRLHVPGEKEKRHGQAVAAASLPAIR
jgi:predicted NBD/HSP70 family sugar kinase